MSNARFSIIQSKAVRDKRVSNSQIRSLLALGMYANEDGWCYPKLATLAKDIGKSKQAISKDITELCKLGYVEKTKQFREDGSQRCNLYRLIFDFGGNRSVNPPSTSEVYGGLTSEVDALTTHINDQYEEESEDEELPERHPVIIAWEDIIKKPPSVSQMNVLYQMLSDWQEHIDSLGEGHQEKNITPLEAVIECLRISANKKAKFPEKYANTTLQGKIEDGYFHNPFEDSTPEWKKTQVEKEIEDIPPVEQLRKEEQAKEYARNLQP